MLFPAIDADRIFHLDRVGSGARTDPSWPFGVSSVIVDENITLTIAGGVSLDIDLSNYHLKVKNGAKVVIKQNARIN